MKNTRFFLWWGLVPVIVFLVTFLPYWILNAAFQIHPWWRIQGMIHGVFDTYSYLHGVGMSVQGVTNVFALSSLKGLFNILWKPFASWATIPEFWLFTRWISTTATVWIFAWMFERWTGASRVTSRWMSVCFWIVLVFVLGMRPGVFSWYLPFGLAGFGLIHVAREKREQGRWLASLSFSFFALALSSVYPWFLSVVGLWLVVEWIEWLFRRLCYPIVCWTGLCLVTIGGLFALTPMLARWFLDPTRHVMLDFYTRTGVVFARFPVITNVLFLGVLWFLILSWIIFRHRDSRPFYFPFAWTWVAWAALLLMWVHTPFTGLYTHNDHFRAPLIVLSWVTASLMFVWQKGQSSEKKSVERWIAGGFFLLSVFFVLHYLRQAFSVWPPSVDNLNVYHLATWLPALILSGVWVLKFFGRVISEKGFLISLGIGSVLVAAMGFASVIQKDLPNMPRIREQVPVVEWIRTHVPKYEALCTSPRDGDFYAAHTGHWVFPAEYTIVAPSSNEALSKKLQILSRIYDFERSGESSTFYFQAEGFRDLACGTFQPQANLLRKVGISSDRIDQWQGCSKGKMAEDWKKMQEAISQPVSTKTVTEACPWIIVREDQKSFWKIPAEYEVVFSNDPVTIFHQP